MDVYDEADIHAACLYVFFCFIIGVCMLVVETFKQPFFIFIAAFLECKPYITELRAKEQTSPTEFCFIR